MDKRIAGKANGVGIEVLLTGAQETLAEVWLGDVLGILAAGYLAGVLGLGPEKAWQLVRKNAPAWCAVGSYECPTRSQRQQQDKERPERE